MAYQVFTSGRTDVGLEREKNEDNFILVPDHRLYIMADGMGGHASGQVASAMAVTHITNFVCVKATVPNYRPMLPSNPRFPKEAYILAEAIEYSNSRIYIQSIKDSRCTGMGTTIVALQAIKDLAILAHVGDSRIYRLRDGILQQLTEDHSLLNHLIKEKGLSEAEIANFPNKNVILRALGLKDEVKVDVGVEQIADGDTFLLCSDGLTDLVEDWIISEILSGISGRDDLDEASETLIRLALQNGGIDNVTVVLLFFEQVTDLVHMQMD